MIYFKMLKSKLSDVYHPFHTRIPLSYFVCPLGCEEGSHLIYLLPNGLDTPTRCQRNPSNHIIACNRTNDPEFEAQSDLLELISPDYPFRLG